MNKKLLVLTFFVILSACGRIGASSESTRPPQFNGEAYPEEIPSPYSATRDANADIDDAFATAQASNKRVIVKFGANWCPDCRLLAAAFEIPKMKRFIDRHFIVVKVDVGRMDHNLDIANRFGVEKLEGVPTVVIAEADGTVVNRSTTSEWYTARERNPQDVADYLFKFIE